MMRKALKLMTIILIILGVALTVINFISVDNMAIGAYPGEPGADGEVGGTIQSNGLCMGDTLNC